MQLQFEKANETISVSFCNKEGEKSKFSYSTMIDMLYKERKILDPLVVGDFSKDERNSIDKLIIELRNVIKVKKTIVKKPKKGDAVVS